MKAGLFISLVVLAVFSAHAQYRCSAVGEKGQMPTAAFPICGTTTFLQDSVPVCSNAGLATPVCRSYPDENPFYYKFTCYQEGFLNFIINPNNYNDDYDWQLYDLTNAASPNDIFTNAHLFVTGNWSGTPGPTGTRSQSTDTLQCFSDPIQNITAFCKPPYLITGHNYILLVSHYAGNAQSGYLLQFNGGTAVITDTASPHIKQVNTDCYANTLYLKFTKGLKCSSLAPDASDFSISPSNASVTSVTGVNCATGFDMDSAVLTLSQPLPPGSYSLLVKNGTDGNTLLDACDNAITPLESVAFTVLPPAPILMDSLTVVKCGPPSLQLVFSKNIQCSSIDADGSDFVITGPTTVTVTGAAANCNSGLGNTVSVNFLAKLQAGAKYQITLVKGKDGHTLTDVCGLDIAAGQTLSFTASPGVSAAFTAQVKPGCVQDTVLLSNANTSGINNWKWIFEDSVIYNMQNITRIYKDSGLKKVSLSVGNETCEDSSSQTFSIAAHIAAAFSSPVTLCPQEEAIFKDSSFGRIVTWAWDFGNGNTSTLQNPPAQSYITSATNKYYNIQLAVKNDSGCADTAYRRLEIIPNCNITVPSAFTPNGDGYNDYLYPLNAYKAVNLQFKVFNRLGQQVFETKDWTRKWDGTVNGKPQSSGVFVWMLAYTDGSTGQKFFLKGTTVLIR
jgi:gliding motility-associated-like protein